MKTAEQIREETKANVDHALHQRVRAGNPNQVREGLLQARVQLMAAQTVLFGEIAAQLAEANARTLLRSGVPLIVDASGVTPERLLKMFREYTDTEPVAEPGGVS